MVQPKTPPLSIRPGDERLAKIDAYAKEHALSRHLAVLVLIDAGLKGDAPVKAAVIDRQKAASEPVAAKPAAKGERLSSVPYAGTFQRPIMQKGAKK